MCRHFLHSPLRKGAERRPLSVVLKALLLAISINLEGVEEEINIPCQAATAQSVRYKGNISQRNSQLKVVLIRL